MLYTVYFELLYPIISLPKVFFLYDEASYNYRYSSNSLDHRRKWFVVSKEPRNATTYYIICSAFVGDICGSLEL